MQYKMNFFKIITQLTMQQYLFNLWGCSGISILLNLIFIIYIWINKEKSNKDIKESSITATNKDIKDTLECSITASNIEFDKYKKLRIESEEIIKTNNEYSEKLKQEKEKFGIEKKKIKKIQKELEESKQELEESKQELEIGKKELEIGKKELEIGKQELEKRVKILEENKILMKNTYKNIDYI